MTSNDLSDQGVSQYYQYTGTSHSIPQKKQMMPLNTTPTRATEPLQDIKIENSKIVKLNKHFKVQVIKSLRLVANTSHSDEPNYHYSQSGYDIEINFFDSYPYGFEDFDCKVVEDRRKINWLLSMNKTQFGTTLQDVEHCVLQFLHDVFLAIRTLLNHELIALSIVSYASWYRDEARIRRSKRELTHYQALVYIQACNYIVHSHKFVHKTLKDHYPPSEFVKKSFT